MTTMDNRAIGAEGIGFATKLVATLVQWRDARIVRRELSRLSDRELDDIGLSRGDIYRVARGR